MSGVYGRRQNFVQMLEGIFKRRYTGGPSDSNTFLFRELPEDSQSKILERLNTITAEKPFIISFANDGSWFSITDQSFFWEIDDTLGHLDWDALESVDSLHPGYEGKTIDPILVLKDRTGNAYNVRLELGSGKYRMWDLLKQIVMQRKRSESKFAEDSGSDGM